MSYFISNGLITIGISFEIDGEEARHINESRRIRLGEALAIQDPNQNRFLCQVTAIGRRSLQLLPTEALPLPPEPALQLVLHQAMVKEKAVDFILQKATELGAAKVVFFGSRHGQKLPQGEEKIAKLERWHRISLEAAKQSDRKGPLEVALSESLQPLPLGASFVLDQGGSTSWKQVTLPGMELHLVVGPEGGWALDELPPDLPRLGMGPRILRADTAALAAITLAQGLWGDMGG